MTNDKPMSKIKVGLYLRNTPKKAIIRLKTLLAESPNFELQPLYAKDIRKGALLNKGIKVVIFPGGSARRQARNLGREGRNKVRQFVREGGGYIGICAGAWLARQSKRGKPLRLVNAKSHAAYIKDGVRKYRWGRQRRVVIRFTEDAKEVFGEFACKGKVIKTYYHNGPMFIRPKKPNPDLPSYTSLATFVSDYGTLKLKEHDAPVEKGADAIISAKYGEGRIVLFSPHLERHKTPELHPFIISAAEWAASN